MGWQCGVCVVSVVAVSGSVGVKPSWQMTAL